MVVEKSEMGIKKKIILGFILATSQVIVRAEEVVVPFQFWRDVREKRTLDYFGVNKPITSDFGYLYSIEKNNLTEDELYIQKVLKKNLQEHPITLSRFWFEDLSTESSCPNEELTEHLEYIRYLYRLVTISYSFESIKRAKKLSTQLGLDANNCSILYKDLFASCKPQSHEMKKFYQRVAGKFANEIEKTKFDKLNKNSADLWWKDYSRVITLTFDPLLSRVNDSCQGSNSSCRDFKPVDLKNSLNSICQEDRQLIADSCNEIDDLMGISNAPKVTELIINSNAFNLLNRNGYGESCLHRFVKVSEKIERKYNHLQRLFTLMSGDITKENGRYPQGDLFLPGALKEFDTKGLSDFLVALEPPKPKPIIKFKPKPKPLIKKIEPIITKVIVPEEKEEVKVEVAEVPKPKISEFERALADMKRFNSTRSEMDMEQFRADFEFTQDQFSALEIPLKRFQTRAALVDMKTYDKMGSKDSPIGLMFIKFLMDTENHQGLFNIQAIIGNKFYVINDFESKVEPVVVELKNDQSTRGRWAIVLMKDL